jgi:hypothetical protein
MLERLHERGRIVKAPPSHRWHASKAGPKVLGAVKQLDHHGIPAALRTAA